MAKPVTVEESTVPGLAAKSGALVKGSRARRLAWALGIYVGVSLVLWLQRAPRISTGNVGRRRRLRDRVQRNAQADEAEPD